MTSNKETVQEYMHAYGRFDRPRVLACLTDDVEWIVPGAFHLTGKAAFESEMSNPAFAGQPEITVSRIVADDDIVVAEGSVRTH